MRNLSYIIQSSNDSIKNQVFSVGNGKCEEKQVDKSFGCSYKTIWQSFPFIGIIWTNFYGIIQPSEKSMIFQDSRGLGWGGSFPSGVLTCR